MAEVLIEKRGIGNQRLSSIGNAQVVLPFNVTQLQAKKLEDLLNKINIKLDVGVDSLSISSLSFNDVQIKSVEKPMPNSNFRIQKAYVATIKSSIVDKVNMFYNRVKEPVRINTIPTINIDKETNLQEALGEVTEEIDLTTINTALNTAPAENPQVLANDPFSQQVNQTVSQPVGQVVQPVASTSEEVAIQPQTVQPTNVAIQNVQPELTVPNEMASMPLDNPKVKVKKLNGYVLAIPVVIVWLGAVLIGTIKLVTSILT